MATKAVNFKMDESEIADIKHVAGVFNMSFTDLLKNAISGYLHDLKKDPYYRLTANIQNASDEESQEILSAIDSMTDDDLSIASTKRLFVSKDGGR